MDLGISGRKAIVCGSSRGLGRAIAGSLARAGCVVVLNGIDAARLKGEAEALHAETGAEIIPVAADVTTREGQDALFAACSGPDILITNAGGPPFKDFRQIDR